MKTTVELPDLLFRRAKSAAAEEGKSLKEFFTEAVTDRLWRNGNPENAPRRWEAAFGGLKHLHRENKRIEKIIEKEFETIDEEEWR
jgi:hypothetical protein